jgi:ferredoxin
LASPNRELSVTAEKSAEKPCQAACEIAERARKLLLTTMADRDDRNSSNVPGKFYVDSQCIDCDLCRETAPNNFARAEDEGYSYVFKQPENDEEIAQCREAIEGCPVEAIGEDGED